MKNAERVVWLVLVAGVSAWALSTHSQSGPRPTGQTSTAEERARSIRAGAAEDTSFARRSGNVDRGGVKARPGPRTTQALQTTDPLQRMSDLLAVLSTCGPGDFAEVRKAWDELKATGISLPAEEALLEVRAGQLQGAELLTGCTGSADDWNRIESRRNEYKGWLQADATAAGRWLDKLPPGKFRDQMALIQIAATARDEPGAALARLSTLPAHLRFQAGKEVALRLRETESVESSSAVLKAMESHAGAADADSLSAMFESLVETATTTTGGDPAASLLENHLGQSYLGDWAWVQVSEATGRSRDAAGALEWALGAEARNTSLPAGALLAGAIREMPLEKLSEAEAWSTANADKPGVAVMKEELVRRMNILENRGADDNEYDRDD